MMSVKVTKEVVTEVKSVTLTLSADAAKELYGLTVAVPVNYVTETFDEIAYQLDKEFDFSLATFVVDENGEYGPYEAPEETSSGGCGCDASFDDDEEEPVEAAHDFGYAEAY